MDTVRVYKHPGVYVLYDHRKVPFYVGTSKNIATRLLWHPYKDLLFKESGVAYLEVLKCHLYSTRFKTERLLISRLKPTHNGYNIGHPTDQLSLFNPNAEGYAFLPC